MKSMIYYTSMTYNGQGYGSPFYLYVYSGLFDLGTDDRMCSMLLRNVWEKVEEARAPMKENGPFKEKDLKRRITG